MTLVERLRQYRGESWETTECYNGLRDEAADALEAAERERDAGREWMRIAWHEFNAIRARDGAPEGVSHEWWEEITEALGEMLGDDRVPWRTKAAEMLLRPHKTARDEADKRAEAAESRATDLSRQLEKAREALEKISANRPAEKADWGDADDSMNMGDAERNGYEIGTQDAADIADAALSRLTPSETTTEGGDGS